MDVADAIRIWSLVNSPIKSKTILICSSIEKYITFSIRISPCYESLYSAYNEIFGG
jgi:hypothetical protein